MMWSVARLCRSAARTAPLPARSYLVTRAAATSRQLAAIIKINHRQGFTVCEVAARRLSASGAGAGRRDCLVGYWLLGCGGMVFAAVVLGTYWALLYCVCRVLAAALGTNRGDK